MAPLSLNLLSLVPLLLVPLSLVPLLLDPLLLDLLSLVSLSMSPLPLNSTCWVFKHFFVYFCFVCGVLYHCLCHRLKKVLPHKGAHTPDL